MGKTNIELLEWEGRDGTYGGQRVLWAEGLDGRPMLAATTGSVIPDNWRGRKVKITVELLD